MALRSVFKFFGSIGPGGTFSTLAEKICTSVYPLAYKYGDPEQMESEIDKKIKKLREEYVLELFKQKNKFEKHKDSEKLDTKDAAFKDLLEIINKYIEKMTRMEKNKYMRERIFYQRNNEIAMYEESNRLYNACEGVIQDNLFKQAITICKITPDNLNLYFSQFKGKFSEGNQADIKDIISEMQAKEFYLAYLEVQ